MSINSTFRRPLSLIAEVRYISRSFSTRVAGLCAASDPTKYSSTSALMKSLPQADTPPSSSRSSDPKAHRARARAMTRDLANPLPKKMINMDVVYAAKEKQERAQSLQVLQFRRWKQGDVYAPHDLSPAEMKKWRSKPRRTADVFDVLAINPVDEYKNYAMMSEYMTELGRIKSKRDTNLRNVNQRRVAKAIRRAIGMGLLPSVHKHPEMLRRGR